MKTRLLWVGILAVFIFVPSRSSGDNSATQVVEELHSTIITVMKKADELKYEGRYGFLEPVIKASYDFKYMCRIITGRYWSDFTEEERCELVEIFTRLSIATYASRCDEYSGESFKLVSLRELRRGRLMVKTVMMKKKRELVELDYVLHNRNNQWLIINVVADGVSDLSLKRADYTAFIKKNGIKALLDKLAEKIAFEAG